MSVGRQNMLSILAKRTKNLNDEDRSEDLRVRSSNMSPPILGVLKSDVDLVREHTMTARNGQDRP